MCKEWLLIYLWLIRVQKYKMVFARNIYSLKILTSYSKRTLIGCCLSVLEKILFNMRLVEDHQDMSDSMMDSKSVTLASILMWLMKSQLIGTESKPHRKWRKSSIAFLSHRAVVQYMQTSLLIVYTWNCISGKQFSGRKTQLTFFVQSLCLSFYLLRHVPLLIMFI